MDQRWRRRREWRRRRGERRQRGLGRRRVRQRCLRPGSARPHPPLGGSDLTGKRGGRPVPGGTEGLGAGEEERGLSGAGTGKRRQVTRHQAANRQVCREVGLGTW